MGRRSASDPGAPSSTHGGQLAAPRGLVDRLPKLLEDWRAVSHQGSLEFRLTVLLDRLQGALPRPTRSRPASLNAERLSALLPLLVEATSQASGSGAAMNPWTVSGIRRREVRNAAVLAALWSPIQFGGVAHSFLSEFFTRCCGAGIRPLPDAAELSGGYRVRAEHCPGPDGSERVDIVIETARCLIGVEVKIDAGEGERQLARYVEAIGRSALQLGKNPVVILLAPFPPSHPNVASATWSTVRAAAASALPKRRRDYEHSHYLLAQFVRHARHF